MPPAEYAENVIAAGFPPGLNTASPAYDLKPDETPDSYGFDLDADGVIKTGSVETGTARVQKTTTISSIPYIWAYHRLWNITNLTAATASNVLRYGAPMYQDVYTPQRSGRIPFDEDAQTILALLPFGPDFMFVAKSTGGYVISNCADSRAFFQRSDIIQELAVSAAARVTELDGNIYACNASGLIALMGGQTTQDMTRKVRDDLTNYANQSITADYAKKRICGTSFVYDVEAKKLFRWSSTDFRFTTRQYHLPNFQPFDADGMLIVLQHGSTAGGIITYQLKLEDDAWQDEEQIDVPYDQETFVVLRESFRDAQTVHKLQIRFTSLSSNLYLQSVMLDRQVHGRDDYVR